MPKFNPVPWENRLFQPIEFMAQTFTLPGVLTRIDPHKDELPVVFDSPHSGNHYPDDFNYAAPLDKLRMAEDAHVDELYGEAPAHGATLLHAHFPRSYIDANRHSLDIDYKLLDEPWPSELQPTRKSEVGMGLIRRVVRDGMPLYERSLAVDEIQRRIGDYYEPYHKELEAIMARLHGRFGAVWHVNCHSMRSSLGRNPRPPTWKPNFIVSNLDGTTSDEPFLTLIADYFCGRGHTVLVNRPFKGGEIVRRHGNPENNRHSVQIEINRKTYMDEVTLEKHDGFEELQETLTGLIQKVCGHAAQSI